MNTSQKKPFLSEVLDGEKIPLGTLSYFRERFRDRLYDLVTEEFLKQEREGNLTRAEVARRIGRRPEQITRWLAAPGNWTLETVSDLLLAVARSEPQVTVLPLDGRSVRDDQSKASPTPPSNQVARPRSSKLATETNDRSDEFGPSVMAREFNQRSDKPAVIAHCDWSINPEKRWMAVAVRENDRWTISLSEEVGDVGSLIKRLESRASEAGPLFLGFDFPIGLPATYGKRTGKKGFKEAVRALGGTGWENWFEVCETASEVSVERPFYPNAPGKAGERRQRHLFDGLEVPNVDGLRRKCELRTPDRPPACMPFWTLGPNQVGKAAIAGWREFIKPNLDQISLWPFDGRLSDLFSHPGIIVAETYPGDVYLQIELPEKHTWNKKTPEGRRATAPKLNYWLKNRKVSPKNGLTEEIDAGFGSDNTGEDRFDALVGLFGMIDVADGQLFEGAPNDPEITTWEGSMLGLFSQQSKM